MTYQPAPALEPAVIKSLLDQYLPSLRDLRGNPIEYVGGGKEPDGTIRLAYPATSPVVYDFIAACTREGVIYPFDWPQFVERARALILPGGIEAASFDELRRLLTTVVRADRFSSGVVEEMVENGVFVRVLERMAALLEQAGDEPR